METLLVRANPTVLIFAPSTVIATIIGLGMYGRALRKEEASARTAVDQAIVQLRENPSIANFVDFNRKEIAQYHVESRGRAKWSFIASLGAMAAGIVIIALGVYFTLAETSTVNKILTTFVTALAGSLSSYITRTFMKAHEQALNHLEYYFRQPLVMSYFLTAERLAQEFKDPEIQMRVYDRIIENVLTAASGETTLGRARNTTSQSKRSRRRSQAEPPSDEDAA
jgi:hypothetical protein